jgi:hypothetical protein
MGNILQSNKTYLDENFNKPNINVEPKTEILITKETWVPVCNILMQMYKELKNQEKSLDDDIIWKGVITSFNDIDDIYEIKSGEITRLDRIILQPDDESYMNHLDDKFWTFKKEGGALLVNDNKVIPIKGDDKLSMETLFRPEKARFRGHIKAYCEEIIKK